MIDPGDLARGNKVARPLTDADTLLAVMGDLKERAERVQEGEEWDLAEFILWKIAALPEHLRDNND